MGDAGIVAVNAQPRLLGTLLAICVFSAGCLAVVMSLRFRRRGAARFWMGPAFVALSVLPGQVATAVTAFAFRARVVSATRTQPFEAVPRSVLAAGAADAQVPLAVGLACVCVVALLSSLALGAGTARGETHGEPAGTGFVTLAAPFVACAGLLPPVFVIALLEKASAGTPNDLQFVLAWLAVVAAAALVALLAIGLAVATARRAAHEPAPSRVKRLPALALLGLATGAVALGALLFSSTTRLLEIARQPWAVNTVVAEGAASAVRPGETPTPTTPAVPGTPVEGAAPSPRVVHYVAPVHPALAPQERAYGLVVLECRIRPDGRIAEVEVRRGAPDLAAAAVEAVRQWVYEPAPAGTTAARTASVTVTFRPH